MSGSAREERSLTPQPLGLAPSFGFGDRLGLATAGHVAAMRAAVEGGRLARLAGRIPKQRFAEPSSPQLGLVGS